MAANPYENHLLDADIVRYKSNRNIIHSITVYGEKPAASCCGATGCC